MKHPLLVAASLALLSCLPPSATTAIEQGSVALCDALLPLATSRIPGPIGASLGPLDALVCQGAETAVATAIGAAAPPATTVGQSVVLAHRPLLLHGRPVALLRAPPNVVAQAQAALDKGGAS